MEEVWHLIMIEQETAFSCRASLKFQEKYSAHLLFPSRHWAEPKGSHFQEGPKNHVFLLFAFHCAIMGTTVIGAHNTLSAILKPSKNFENKNSLCG